MCNQQSGWKSFRGSVWKGEGKLNKNNKWLYIYTNENASGKLLVEQQERVK